MLTRSTGTRLDDQRKDHIDKKRTQAKESSKKLQTHNQTNDDVENINNINNGRDLLLANKLRRNRKDAAKDPQSYFT